MYVENTIIYRILVHEISFNVVSYMHILHVASIYLPFNGIAGRLFTFEYLSIHWDFFFFYYKKQFLFPVNHFSIFLICKLSLPISKFRHFSSLSIISE